MSDSIYNQLKINADNNENEVKKRLLSIYDNPNPILIGVIIILVVIFLLVLIRKNKIDKLSGKWIIYGKYDATRDKEHLEIFASLVSNDILFDFGERTEKGVLDGDRIIIDDCVAIPNNDSINIYKNDGVLTYKKLSF